MKPTRIVFIFICLQFFFAGALMAQAGSQPSKSSAISALVDCYTPLYVDRPNLVSDPDVSSLANYTMSWGTGATITSDPTLVYCGQFCGKVSGTNAGSITYSLVDKWLPNRSYRIKAKVNVVSGTFELSVASWSSATTANIINTIPVTNGWKDIDFTFTTGASLGNVSNQFFFFNNYGHGAGVGYIDNIEMYDMTLPVAKWIGGPYTLDGISQSATVPSKVLENATAYTISAWVKPDSVGNGSRVFDFGSSAEKHMYLTAKGRSNNIEFAITDSGSTGEQYISAAENTAMSAGVWHHVVVVQNGSTGIMYLNGNEIGRNANITLGIADLDSLSTNYIGKSQTNDSYLGGQFEEFKIYDSAFTRDKVLELIKIPKATKPTPADGFLMISSAGTPRVSWVKGKYLTSSNVYFGTSYNDVMNATIPFKSGLTPDMNSAEISQALTEGQIYFWRVDGVNGSQITKGDVWKFKYMGPKIKVFLLGGQSNMAGTTPLTQIATSLKREYPEVIIWTDGEADASMTKKWMTLIPGLGRNKTLFGPELSFGPEIAKYLPNDNIALMKCAWGSTDLVKQWRSPSSGGTTGSMYTSFIKSMQDGMAALPVGCQIEIAGMLWIQGENDAKTSLAAANEYESNLKNLIKDVRAVFKVPEMPFIIGQISEAPAWDAYGAIVRQAQLNVSKSVQNTDMFITSDYGLTDVAHYNGAGEISLGKRFATSAYNVLTSKGLKAELFNADDFVNPKVVRVDPAINFNWGSSTPDVAITATDYAVRWSGYIRPQLSATYTFSITTGNGVRLWVNDVLIIDNFSNTTENVLTGSILLNVSAYSSIKLEFRKNTETASVKLEWSASGIAKQPVPTKVLYQHPLSKIDNAKWVVKSVDSESSNTTAGGAIGVLDNKYTTYWKSKLGVAFPHELAIDLNDTLNIAALDYVPNQMDAAAGNVLQYKVYTSMDGVNWQYAVDSGVWENSMNQKTASFVPVVARYVKLKALTSSGTTVSASDISVHGVQSNWVDSATGVINTYVNDAFSVYPSLATDFITIKLDGFSSAESVRLNFYNVSGRSVYSCKVGTNRSISLDCRNILNRSGVYIVVASSTTNSFAKKIVYYGL